MEALTQFSGIAADGAFWRRAFRTYGDADDWRAPPRITTYPAFRPVRLSAHVSRRHENRLCPKCPEYDGYFNGIGAQKKCPKGWA